MSKPNHPFTYLKWLCYLKVPSYEPKIMFKINPDSYHTFYTDINKTEDFSSHWNVRLDPNVKTLHNIYLK